MRIKQVTRLNSCVSKKWSNLLANNKIYSKLKQVRQEEKRLILNSASKIWKVLRRKKLNQWSKLQKTLWVKLCFWTTISTHSTRQLRTQTPKYRCLISRWQVWTIGRRNLFGIWRKKYLALVELNLPIRTKNLWQWRLLRLKSRFDFCKMVLIRTLQWGKSCNRT